MEREAPDYDRFSRLREWLTDWSVGRYERPQYANPGELKADIREVIAERDELRAALEDATAFRTAKALNRARVALGGPDMEKHAPRCRLFGDGRVECAPECEADRG